MSNIAEILRKAEYFQNNCSYVDYEDPIYQYRMGMMCYNVKDYDGAEFWWEKATRNHYLMAKKALMKLYEHQLKNKYHSIPKIAHVEAKGKVWPVSSGGREIIWLSRHS